MTDPERLAADVAHADHEQVDCDAYLAILLAEFTGSEYAELTAEPVLISEEEGRQDAATLFVFCDRLRREYPLVHGLLLGDAA